MRTKAWLPVPIVLAVAFSLLTAPVILAASVNNGYPPGYFNWCDPDSCTYWFSSSDGATTWTTTFEHSEGQSYYQIAPFQQDEFLVDGNDLHPDGIWPQANWYSVIKWPNGSVYLSNYKTTGPGCWAFAIPGSWQYWHTCSTYGFSMATTTYPPGSVETHYQIWANGITGGFGGVYSGSLS